MPTTPDTNFWHNSSCTLTFCDVFIMGVTLALKRTIIEATDLLQENLEDAFWG